MKLKHPFKAMARNRPDAAAAVSLALTLALLPVSTIAQACTSPLAESKRLVLVVAETMNSTAASLQLFERGSPKEAWRPLGAPEPALVGRAGMAWSHFFRDLRRDKEPIKVEGDKRAPAGFYKIGRTFGTVPSSRPGHVHIPQDTVCVDDPSSSAYNTITHRSQIGPKVHGENMSRALPMYRRGLLVDYPTDAKARAGSCIFIHVWKSPTIGTAGCVSLPEPRVVALQDFSAAGAVLAIVPRSALDRLQGCLPVATAARQSR